MVFLGANEGNKSEIPQKIGITDIVQSSDGGYVVLGASATVKEENGYRESSLVNLKSSSRELVGYAF